MLPVRTGFRSINDFVVEEDMEALGELGVALFVAAVLISLFAISRLATRSPSSPAWVTSTLSAYLFAVPFTIAVAASLGYLGFALQPFVGVFMAGLMSVAVHVALLAVFRALLPVREELPVVDERRSNSRSDDAVAA